MINRQAWHRRKSVRKTGATSAPRIDAPQALILRREPKANVARYDTLRDKDLRHAS